MNLGENIRKARKAAGVWENGAHAPTIEMFAKICRELNASADEILELK